MSQETQTEAKPTPADRSQRQYNFSAGPAALPEETLLEAKEELPVFDNAGASVMEISHRSAAYDKVEESAREHIKSLLDIGDEWNVLFLQGGASMQFYQAPPCRKSTFHSSPMSSSDLMCSRAASSTLS